MTEDDRYPLPHIQDFAAGLAGARYFSVLDLQRGYHQIPMAAEDVPKTAIITPFGLYEYLRMPFGLKNSAQAFQRMMRAVLGGLPFAFVYLDDVLVASRTLEEHEVHVRQVLTLLQQNGLAINEKKCVWAQQQVCLLYTSPSPRD